MSAGGGVDTSGATDLQRGIVDGVHRVAPNLDSQTVPFDVAEDWNTVAELGWFEIADPDAGTTASDVAILARELGRVVASGPVLSTMLAVRVARSLGDGETLDALTSGVLRASTAVVEEGGITGDRFTGCIRVRDHAPGSAIVLLTRDRAALVRPGLLTDPGGASSIDPSTTIARHDVGGLEVTVSRDPADRDFAALLSAAYLAGLARRAVETSVAYALARTQFGKQIGSFQAVKHRCADMHVRATAAWAQTRFAAESFDAGPPASAADIAAAFVLAARAARSNGSDNIRNHGAIGFTAETLPHRLVRRSIFESQFGAPLDELIPVLLRADDDLPKGTP